MHDPEGSHYENLGGRTLLELNKASLGLGVRQIKRPHNSEPSPPLMKDLLQCAVREEVALLFRALRQYPPVIILGELVQTLVGIGGHWVTYQLQQRNVENAIGVSKA